MLVFALINFIIISAAQQINGNTTDYYGNPVNYSTNRGLAWDTKDHEYIQAALRKVLNFMDAQPNIELAPDSDVANLMAIIDNQGRPLVIYNPAFVVNVLEGKESEWILMTILAHEIGHHAKFHVQQFSFGVNQMTGGERRNLELEADAFSGFLLYKLGATLEQAQLAVKHHAKESANSTHPGQESRLSTIASGWYRAKEQEISNPRVRPTLTTLSLSSQPSEVVVYLDGQYFGVTPLSNIEVSAGEHTIRLTKKDYLDVQESLSLEAGQHFNHHYKLNTLKRTTGMLSVNSNLIGAEVYIDDRYFGSTPLNNTSLDVGIYQVEIRAKGYVKQFHNIEIFINEVQHLAITLEPEPLLGYEEDQEFTTGNASITKESFDLASTSIAVSEDKKQILPLNQSLFAGVFNDERSNFRLFLVTNFNNKVLPRPLTVVTPKGKTHDITLDNNSYHLLKDIRATSGDYEFSTKIEEVDLNLLVNIDIRAPTEATIGYPIGLFTRIIDGGKIASINWHHVRFAQWYKIEVYSDDKLIAFDETNQNSLRVNYSFERGKDYLFCVTAFNWQVGQSMPKTQPSASRACRKEEF